MKQTTQPRLIRPSSLAMLALAIAFACASPPEGLSRGTDHDAAGRDRFRVGGSVTGLRSNLNLQLNGSEFVSVEGDGDFTFATALRTGDPFTVTIVDQPAGEKCEVANGTGVVATADITDVDVTCNLRVGLASLDTSVPGFFSVSFDPSEEDIQLTASVLISEITLTPTAINDDSVVEVGGVGIPGGSSTLAIPLSLGANEIDIVVKANDGETRSYVVEVLRGANVVGLVEVGLGSNPDAQDQFSTSVALSGDLLAVGTSFEDSAATGINGDEADNSAPNSGAVYIFRRQGIVWTQEAYLKASNAETGDQFGASIAFAGDTLVVAAKSEDSNAIGINENQDDNSAPESGAVYVFRNSGTTWTQEAFLKASNTEEGDAFGTSVALHGDTLVVGAPGEDGANSGVNGDSSSNGSSFSGAAYVFRRSGTVWAQEAYVKASNTGAVDQFGASVSLLGDTLAVGAIREDSDSTGVGGGQFNDGATRSGAVYVFRRLGTLWAQEAYIKASNTSEDTFFGTAVSVSEDRLAVAALGEDSGATGVDGNQADLSATDSGAVYVFRRDGMTWSQEAYLKASNTESLDKFGTGLALSGDILAIGAPGEGSDSDDVDGDQSDNSAFASGAVYLYRRDGLVWSQEAYVKGSLSKRNNLFGNSVSLSGDALVIGAPGRDRLVSVPGGGINVIAAGTFYVFQ